MTQQENSSATLMRMILGYQVSQAIHVAAVLGIADLLRDGPRSVTSLAQASDCHPGALYRLLRALAAIGIFHESREREFSLATMGEYLRADHPQSALGWAVFMGQDSQWATWSSLLHSIRTGENAFRSRRGKSVWEARAEDPALGVLFDAAMTTGSKLASATVLDLYDFSQFGTIADVGGGRGALLAHILSANPDMRGVLFDQPNVVSDYELKAAGVLDRCEIEGGSFFKAVPAGADAYLLKSIIHDWEDAEATAILETCVTAMRPDSKLLLVEFVLSEPNEGPRAKFSDLNMLVAPGGRERTTEEYGALLAAAGLRMEKVYSSGSETVCVIEAVPA